MTPAQKQSFIDIIHSCEDVILATHSEGAYPDARNVINIFNHGITDLELHFFSATKWRTPAQVKQNPKICLYYFNSTTRMSLRLFGTMEIIDDMKVKLDRWLDDIKKFGVAGYDDPSYIFMRFSPKRYKYYIGPTLYEGDI
jgi:general stress protein 26